MSALGNSSLLSTDVRTLLSLTSPDLTSLGVSILDIQAGDDESQPRLALSREHLGVSSSPDLLQGGVERLLSLGEVMISATGENKGWGNFTMLECLLLFNLSCFLEPLLELEDITGDGGMTSLISEALGDLASNSVA